MYRPVALVTTCQLTLGSSKSLVSESPAANILEVKFWALYRNC